MPVLPELDDLIENGGRFPGSRATFSGAPITSASWRMAATSLTGLSFIKARSATRTIRKCPITRWCSRTRGRPPRPSICARLRRRVSGGFCGLAGSARRRARRRARSCQHRETARQAAHGRTRQLHEQHPHRRDHNADQVHVAPILLYGQVGQNKALKRSLKIYYQDQAIMEKVRRSSYPSTFRPS